MFSVMKAMLRRAAVQRRVRQAARLQVLAQQERHQQDLAQVRALQQVVQAMREPRPGQVVLPRALSLQEAQMLAQVAERLQQQTPTHGCPRSTACSGTTARP